MDVDTDMTLRSRYWVRTNFEWLMSEVAFHRDMKKYFRNQRIPLWTFDSPEGSAKIYEIT